MQKELKELEKIVEKRVDLAFKRGFYSGQAMAGVELDDCHKNWKKLNKPEASPNLTEGQENDG